MPDPSSPAAPAAPAAPTSAVARVLTPRHIAASLTELWSPRVIAELDDNYVKTAKVHGELAWHAHDAEDELFFILSGELRLDFEDGTHALLREGDLHVVPAAAATAPSPSASASSC
jgi:quercetin dioxygenase-like cupin family protein